MSDHSADRPERPRSEPEIIPPGEDYPLRTDAPGAAPDQGVFILLGRDGQAHYTSFRPPGPLTTLLALLVGGLIVGTILVVLLGFVLFWVPVVVLAAAALIFSGYLRGLWARLTRG